MTKIEEVARAMAEALRAETYETSGPRCPYCLHLHHADEPAFYDENNSPFECESCLKPFHMEVYQRTSWTCSAFSEGEERG